MSDRRAVLEAIAYGDDSKVTPGDRLKALEQLREFERVDPTDDLDPDEIWAEIDSFHATMLSAMFVASGSDLELDPGRFPMTADALRKIVGRMTELSRTADELAGHWGEVVGDPLPAPEPDEPTSDADVVWIPEPLEDGVGLPSGDARRQLPPAGIDVTRGWPR